MAALSQQVTIRPIPPYSRFRPVPTKFTGRYAQRPTALSARRGAEVVADGNFHGLTRPGQFDQKLDLRGTVAAHVRQEVADLKLFVCGDRNLTHPFAECKPVVSAREQPE